MASGIRLLSKGDPETLMLTTIGTNFIVSAHYFGNNIIVTNKICYLRYCYRYQMTYGLGSITIAVDKACYHEIVKPSIYTM